MKTYVVRLTADATVETYVTVHADTETAARFAAKERVYNGDVIWKYTGCYDDTAEVQSVVNNPLDDE